VKTRTNIQLLAYSALIVSLFLPSKANEMTSQFGEHVKSLEPSVALHLRILFSPLMEWLDYQSFTRNSDLPNAEAWAGMWKNISYWLPITLTGWLFLVYPALQKLKSLSVRRRARYFALVTTIVGTGILIHHLIRWATIYDGYYHMGSGGYFLMSAYLLVALLILTDIINNDRDQPTVA
jgi:hypothetical protein